MNILLIVNQNQATMYKYIYIFILILKANDIKQQRINVLANTCHSSVVSMMFQNPSKYL